MRTHVSQIHRSLGDLVHGTVFTVPNNPFTAPATARGVGDLTGPIRFSVPNNPFTGMAGLGHGSCGGDCDCGPCRSRNGMGQVDYSLTGSGIITTIEGALNQTGWPSIPNWVFYAGGVFAIYALFLAEPKYTVSRRRR